MSGADLDDVIAERTLALRTAGAEADVRVRLGRPRPDPASAHGDWLCPVEIHGPARRRGLVAHGVDSFQALLLAVQMLNIELRALERATGGRLWFLDSADAGIPNWLNTP